LNSASDWCRKGDAHIAALNETIMVLVQFRIRGRIRFLSHAETVKVFQRACTRAGIKIRYSQGFNPHPRLSLPLPRSVGVESDDDLLCIQLESSAAQFDTESFRQRLSSQLPEGCELLDIRVAETKTSLQPRTATYVLAVRQEVFDEALKSRIKHLMASEGLDIKRQIDAKGNTRNVDVRPFLKSIKIVESNNNDSLQKDDRRGSHIIVECKTGSAGSIRVEEILKLLQLNVRNLTRPIRRKNIRWQSN